MKKSKVHKVSKFTLLTECIEWDNWHDDEAEEKYGEDIYLPISGVVFSRLAWLKEQIESGDIDKDEALETIEMAQAMVDGVKDNDLHKQKINPAGFKYL